MLSIQNLQNPGCLLRLRIHRSVILQRENLETLPPPPLRFVVRYALGLCSKLATNEDFFHDQRAHW